MPIYMKIDGVVGSATVKPFVGWIELESASMGGNRQVNGSTSGGTSRAKPGTTSSEIIVTKHMDKASSTLLKLSQSGEGKKVTIAFVKKQQNVNKRYLTIELEDTRIASYVVSGSHDNGKSGPLETITLNYMKSTYKTSADARDVQPGRTEWVLTGA